MCCVVCVVTEIFYSFSFFPIKFDNKLKYILKMLHCAFNLFTKVISSHQ